MVGTFWIGFEVAFVATLLGLRSTVRRGDTESPVRTKMNKKSWSTLDQGANPIKLLNTLIEFTMRPTGQ